MLAIEEITEINTAQLQNAIREEKGNIFILDVREPSEYVNANLGGHLIPLDQLQGRIREIPRDKTIIVHCQHGVRSMFASHFLLQQGFENVFSLRGGIQSAL